MPGGPPKGKFEPYNSLRPQKQQNVKVSGSGWPLLPSGGQSLPTAECPSVGTIRTTQSEVSCFGEPGVRSPKKCSGISLGAEEPGHGRWREKQVAPALSALSALSALRPPRRGAMQSCPHVIMSECGRCFGSHPPPCDLRPSLRRRGRTHCRLVGLTAPASCSLPSVTPLTRRRRPLPSPR